MCMALGAVTTKTGCVCYLMKEYVGSHQGTVNTFQNSVDVLVKCDSYFAIARLIILLN